MFELVSRLVETARYADAERLVQALELSQAAVGDMVVAELLAAACEADDGDHQHDPRARARWPATVDAATESQLRRHLNALLVRTADDADAPTPPSMPAPAALAVFCLGPLRVRQGDRDLGAFPNRRAKSVFKYLLLHRDQVTPKERLMDTFWPNAAPAAARNNLNVAVHGLRRVLGRTGPHVDHVLFQGEGYLLNPELELCVDLTEFDRRVAEGRRRSRQGDTAGALRAFEEAETLYQGALFEDDAYEDWTAAPRRAAEDHYVEVLATLATLYRAAQDDEACIRVSRKILLVQPTCETAHRQLMRSYARLDRRHLAIRQFHDCASVLRSELDVAPDPHTVELYHRIRGGLPVRARLRDHRTAISSVAATDR
jgi:DNA-binding SARP family transcriptional activator